MSATFSHTPWTRLPTGQLEYGGVHPLAPSLLAGRDLLNTQRLAPSDLKVDDEKTEKQKAS